MMVIIWKHLGWLTPLIVVAAMIATQLGTNLIYGEGAYKASEFIKNAGVLSGIALVGVVGIYLNWFKRGSYINEKTGEPRREAFHSMFFIPMEYWSIIFAGLWVWLEFGGI